MGFGGAKAAKNAAAAQVAGQQAGIDEQRSRFNSISEMLAPFITQGKSFLDDTGAGATIGGFGQSLNDIMGSDIFQQLRGKRVDAINSAFGNRGMLNSGGRAAAIGNDLTDLGLSIEDLLYGRQREQANMGLNATQGLAGFSNSAGTNISNLLAGQGEARASGILGAQQARSGLTSQLLGLGMGAAGGALAGGSGLLSGAGGETIGAGMGSLLGLFFSDERLKENIRPLFDVGPLTVYEWDWIPEVAHLNLPMRTGFMAQEVEAIFPKYVHKVGAFKAIDYDGLLKRLDQVIH
jgi:hypothetical protein